MILRTPIVRGDVVEVDVGVNFVQQLGHLTCDDGRDGLVQFGDIVRLGQAEHGKHH